MPAVRSRGREDGDDAHGALRTRLVVHERKELSLCAGGELRHLGKDAFEKGCRVTALHWAREGYTETRPMVLGQRSTLFLAYAFKFEEGGSVRLDEHAAREGADWKRRPIQGAALLPHLDDYVKKGELLRAYEIAGDLRGAFGPRERWTLTDADGSKSLDVTIVDPPRLYGFDTGYAFIVLSVAPAPALEGEKLSRTPDLTLALLQDTAYHVVRAGGSRVGKTPPQMRRWLDSKGLSSEEEPITLRQFLARLVPGLPAEAPRGTPRTQAPAMFSVVLAPERLAEDDLHRLRLVHRSDQSVEPGVNLDEAHGVWRVSTQELCMFSSFGFSWVAHDYESSKFLSDAPHMIRDRYVYKWLIVEHQRLCLLALATECADMSKGLDGGNFAEMRLNLLTFIAKYNFRHISNEERHDHFYQRAQIALGIEDLLAEVREEVVEIDTQLASRRAETLNHVLAFLTLVLTPVGIVVGVFQSETLPGKFRLGHLVSIEAWGKLVTHGPFVVVVLAGVLGGIAYTRLFGIGVVTQLLRTVLWKRPPPNRDVK